MSLYNKASLVLIPSGTKAGKVYSQKPVPSNDVLGDELVTNGTFDTDSDWTKGTGWTIANGVASCDGTQTAKTTLESVSNLPLGKDNIFKITFDIVNYSSGSIDVVTLVGTGGAEISDISGNGSYTAYSFGPSTADNKMQIKAESDFVGSIDNVSVRQVVDGDFDFTRSSYATRVNSQGLIEKERGNLLLQSNNFDTTWVNSGTITRTSGQSGYDGSNDAWLLTKGSAGAFIRQTNSQSGVYTFSVYAKADTSDWLLLDIDGSPDAFQYFDLGNGVLGASGTNVDATITSVGGSWYRCSVTGADTYTEVRIYPAEGNNNVGGTTTQLYIQDAQLEQGLVATDYIETTTAAVYEGITDNVPRLDYDGDCPSLLLEPQRTNEVEHSEYMEDSIWQKQSGVTVDSNTSDTTSPEGKYNANKITSTNGTTGVYINTFSKTTDIVRTVYIKGENGGESITIKDGSGNGGQTNVTLTTEWVRYEHKTTSDGNNYQGMFLDDIPTTSAIYVYGAQVEEGSYATSYIPTYGTSVTRNEDFCDNAGDSTIFNNQEGVLYAEIAALNDDLTFRVIGLSDDTNSNIVKFGYRADSNAIYFEARDGNVSQAFQIAYVSDITQFHKVAIKFKENDFAMWIDGSEVKTDNLGTVPSGMTMINFDGGNGFANFLGKVKSLAYFNRALTDTELADLTT